MNKSIISVMALCVAFFMVSGCGKKEGYEPTKYNSQAGLEKLTAQAQTQAQALKRDNPAFYTARNISLASADAQDIDAAVRPVLKKYFGDAKAVADLKSQETKIDGEVVENRITYVVKRMMVAKDGKPLHSELRAAHFGASPRLGSEPTIWSGGAVMSLFQNTSRRAYSLVINVDTRKQQVVVESYRLGSKYDRLM